MEATDEDFYWLPGHLDPLMTHAWSGSTVATLSREIKIVCKHYLEKTSDTLAPLDFMLHDFGFRGASCVEEAQIQGLGHLVNFYGTDTLVAIECGMDYYDSGVCAYSVPATEHSIMTSLGPNGEEQVLRYLLKRFPTGILSVVIDSYNYERFITKIAANCKDEILARDGKLVFRPDSGEPVSTSLQTLELIEHVFGSSQNSKQCTVLNPKTGALWGDGIKYIGVRNILNAMMDANFSAENIVFGMGGGIHSSTDRDTQRFAFKSSAQKRAGVWHDIFKRPTEISKASKKGRQFVYNIEGADTNNFVTTNIRNDNLVDVIQPVLEDGYLLRDMKFDEVRENAMI
jgi:nicotinamide phosphoribosyltransferase